MSKNLFNVENKVVIVTGGMGQLGRQFTLSLINLGAKVAVFDLLVDSQHIESTYGPKMNDEKLLFVHTDITQRGSILQGLSEVEKIWGIPHALINNAAMDSPPGAPAEENGPYETYPEASWDKVLDVNVKGPFLCCQVIGSKMAEEKRGSIINISSIYGILSPDQRIYEYRRQEGDPFYKPVAYSVSKSAVLNLTRYLATYWAASNIRVNTLTFAGVYNHQDEHFLKEYCAKVPLGRMADESEYNGAVVFLVSDASSYMTGSNMVIDGGWSAW